MTGHRSAFLLATASFVVSFALLAPVLFFGAILLGGPHSDVLPGVLQPVVVMVAWAVLFAVPAIVARMVFLWRLRRAGRA